jgi:hypothetical protein
MILWWVRVLNDFEVNSEEPLLRSTFLHLTDFFSGNR